MMRLFLILAFSLAFADLAAAASTPCAGEQDAFDAIAEPSPASESADAAAPQQGGVWDEDAYDAPALDEACRVLHQELVRPRMRSEPIVIGSYTDILTPPQSRTECTHVYDTGVPDPMTCTTVYDDCASKWEGPFGTWGCIPGTTTKCDNAKACDTWSTDIKQMQCDLTLTMKLPNFIDRPLQDFIDDANQVTEATRNELAGALPIECAGEVGRQQAASGDPGQAIANAITAELTRQVRQRVEEEARAWLTETIITTVAASIPSGGLGGAAAMATELATLIYRIEARIRPIVRFIKDSQALAEDMGFGTSCGWGEWHKL